MGCWRQDDSMGPKSDLKAQLRLVEPQDPASPSDLQILCTRPVHVTVKRTRKRVARLLLLFQFIYIYMKELHSRSARSVIDQRDRQKYRGISSITIRLVIYKLTRMRTANNGRFKGCVAVGMATETFDICTYLCCIQR